MSDLAVGRAVTLRRATDADRDFLLALYGSTRQEELAQVVWPDGEREAFLALQFDLQDRQYRAHATDASFDVVEVDGRPAGRLTVDRRPDDVRVVDIALLPEHRGLGIGGRLLRGVLEEARASRRTVSLHVDLHSRAGSLYTRLGFVPVADDGVRRLMVWRAS